MINMFRSNYQFAPSYEQKCFNYSFAQQLFIEHLQSFKYWGTKHWDKVVDPTQGNIHAFTGEVPCLVEKTHV